MSLSLYKQMMKTNMKMFLGFAIGSAIYVSLMTTLFPMIEDNMAQIDEMLVIFPEALMRALGLESMSTYSQFIAVEYYGLFYLFIVGVFTIIISIHLIARLVDQGSMAYLLSTRVSRAKIATTQIVVLISGLLMIHIVTFSSGYLFAKLSIGSESELALFEFFQINLIGFLLFFAIGGYSLLISTLFNDEKNAFALAGGITFIFYGIDMIGKVVAEIEWIRSFSLFSLYEPGKIASGDANIWLSLTIFMVIGIIGYVLSILIFKKRNLPI